MDVFEATARALFVTAWADQQESQGVSFSGMELMDCAPETPEAVHREAYRLIGMIEHANGLNIWAIVRFAAKCDGFSVDEGLAAFGHDLATEAVPDGFESDFGHCLAMEAMGTGVAWTDDHAKVTFTMPDRGLDVPHFEFTMFDLDPNEFPIKEEEE